MALQRIEHKDYEVEVNLSNGQLVSFKDMGKEFMHDGGKYEYNGSGWSNSEIICFPIFGPADDNKVRVGSETFDLEQHGLSRYHGFKVSRLEDDSITLVQEYDGSGVKNPKFDHGNGHPEHLNWLPYTLTKTFRLTDGGLECEITVTNKSDIDMPYMMGWHPAFKLHGEIKDSSFFPEGKKSRSLEDVIKASKKEPECASEIEGANTVLYFDKKLETGIWIASPDLNNTMLWSPNEDSGMFCIEHTSKIPVHRNQDYFSDLEQYEVLAPEQSKSYRIVIQPFSGTR